MKRNLHWLLLGALLLSFAFDAIVWSAASQMPGAGVHLHRSARREAPLTYLYMTAGRPLIGVGALRDYGDSHAHMAFSTAADEIALAPELAMEIAHGPARSTQHATLKWMHYAPVVLFFAWLVAYILRPRNVHMVGKRR